MIRLRTGLLATALIPALWAVPGKADVMEVNADGARWITGELALVGMAVPDGSDIVIPDRAIANAALHALTVPPEYAEKVAELARRFDLSPALIEALVWQESRWRADAVSPKGARGLAQLMPATARYLGVDPDDPMANLEGGARYLREQLDRFEGDLEKALAAYNAGPGRVEKAGGVPAITETRHYVAAIMGRLSNHSREDYQ